MKYSGGGSSGTLGFIKALAMISNHAVSFLGFKGHSRVRCPLLRENKEPTGKLTHKCVLKHTRLLYGLNQESALEKMVIWGCGI